VTPRYTLERHTGHQWIERPGGMNRLPSRYSYYDESEKVVEELNRLVDRINRLEQSGDALEKWLDRNTPITVRNDWKAAREANP
jgi:hypothetical protein